MQQARGRACLCDGRPQEALELFERAVAVEPATLSETFPEFLSTVEKILARPAR